MSIASAAQRFWKRRPTMAQVETAWPAVRLGVIRDAWRLYRRHWTVWSLTMLVSMICVAIGEAVVALALKSAGAGMFGGLLGLRAPGIPLLHGVLGVIIAG